MISSGWALLADDLGLFPQAVSMELRIGLMSPVSCEVS
jgi:hypothetical protein